MAKTLIVAKGGFGDLFPLFAIAGALRARGHEVIVAAEHHHAPACAMLGIRHVPLGKANPVDRAAVRGNKRYTLREQLGAILPPDDLDSEVRQLLPLACDVDIILGNQLSYAGAIVRDMLRKPWVFCAASPLAIPSRLDPPLWPYLHRLQRRTSPWGVPESTYIDLARLATRVMMGPHHRLRRRLGLHGTAHARFEGMYSRELNLMLTSPRLLEPQSDWPTPTKITGFCWFEPMFLGNRHSTEDLLAFAGAGSPPILIAPGGSRRMNPGGFFKNAIAACRQLGRRAIIVAAQSLHGAIPKGPDIMVTGYLPYSSVLGQTAATIHSAGIGTLGLALRCGVPSLLLPGDWDQHDNARRAERMGYAKVLHGEADAGLIAPALAHLLDDPFVHERLRAAAPYVAAEDGAAAACQEIEARLAINGVSLPI
jgi:UDP:flavonoid glycosyltransferase YjiC (YdhE family)